VETPTEISNVTDVKKLTILPLPKVVNKKLLHIKELYVHLTVTLVTIMENTVLPTETIVDLVTQDSKLIIALECV
jgi:hypothetical protein